MSRSDVGDALDSILSDRSDVVRVGDLAGRSDLDLWTMLERAGFLGVGVREAHGGAGGSLRDAAEIGRVAGRYLVGLPIVEVGLIGGWLLDRAQLPLPERRWTASPTALSGSLSTDGLHVRGSATRIPHARDAQAFVVPAIADNGDCYVAVVPLDAASVEPGRNVAGEPRDTISVDVIVAPGRFVEISLESVTEARYRAALGRSLQIAGAMSGVLELTVRYAADRHQFGRPLTAHQAVQQHLAALAGETAAAQAAAEGALAELEDCGVGALLAIAAAKVRTGQAASTASSLAHQVHGAMGMTLEYPLRLFTTRLWSWQSEYGTAAAWSKRIGAVVLDQRPAGVWQTLAPV
jgi:acyl-CoA dehydrogenase